MHHIYLVNQFNLEDKLKKGCMNYKWDLLCNDTYLHVSANELHLGVVIVTQRLKKM